METVGSAPVGALEEREELGRRRREDERPVKREKEEAATRAGEWSLSRSGITPSPAAPTFPSTPSPDSYSPSLSSPRLHSPRPSTAPSTPSSVSPPPSTRTLSTKDEKRGSVLLGFVGLGSLGRKKSSASTMSRGSSASEEMRSTPMVEVGEEVEDEEDMFRSSGQVRVGSKAAALLGLGAATTSVPVHVGVESARRVNMRIGLTKNAAWEGEVRGNVRPATRDEAKEALPAFPSMRVELVSNQVCALSLLPLGELQLT